MKQTKLGLLICLTAFLSQYAAAAGPSVSTGSDGWYVEETFFPVYVKRNDAQSGAGGSHSNQVGTETGLGFDFRTSVGYIWSNVIFGLTYNYYSVNTSRPLTPDYEGLKTSTTKSDFGPSLGYVMGDFRFVLSYFLMATKTYHETYTDPVSGQVTTDNNYKDTGGSGFQLALTYGLSFGSGWSIGPTLIYREVRYQKQSLDGSSSSYPASSTVTIPLDAELKPMVTIGYRF